MEMSVLPTALQDITVVETGIFSDSRGDFARLFCSRELESIIGDRRIAQINLSRTEKKGAVRGFHFQYPPFAEFKMIRCLKGQVFDVAVDLRAQSSTFLQWHAETLTPENRRMLIIPEGCAHGFQVMEPNSELLYLHTAPYEPEHEGGIRFDDPAIGVHWPIEVQDVSQRDREHPEIDEKFSGVEL